MQAYPTGREEDNADKSALPAVDVQEAGPTDGLINEYGDEVDPTYKSQSTFDRFRRSVLLQMILLGALSFSGPSMSDGISNLGGGGLSTPYLANLASSLNYACSCAMTLIGGPLINKVGIKWACIIASVGYPMSGSAFYVRARFKIDDYLLAAKAVSGFTGGFLYVAESSAMLTYPYPNSRGTYLGIWAAMRNAGSVLGGAINFGNNSKASGAGAIAWSTYLIFVGIECTGIIWGFCLSKTKHVRRRDGSTINLPPTMSWASEIKALWAHATNKKTFFMFIPAFYSFFCGGTFGTYLSLHFSVRSRALSSLIYPIVAIIIGLAYGRMLDYKGVSQKKRAWIGLGVWVVSQGIALIWAGIMYAHYGDRKVAIDYKLHPGAFAVAWLPYLLMNATSYIVQMHIYWVLGTFSTNLGANTRTGGLFRTFETAGQAVSYGINSHSGSDVRTPFYAQCGIYVLAVVSMSLLCKLVPEHATRHDGVLEEYEVPTQGRMAVDTI